MKPFDPDFEVIKMDAEVTSYQSDDEPERPVEIAEDVGAEAPPCAVLRPSACVVSR